MTTPISPDRQEILDYYAAGVEGQRLKRGIGQLELERSKELVLRFAPPPPALVYDVGGGTGTYALWLAQIGYTVHLLELSPENVEVARAASDLQPRCPLAAAEVADALSLCRPDGSADIVLLMGPLYHLTCRAARLQALAEARRVLKPGGLLLAAAISRFGSTLWGITSYGQPNYFLEEKEFQGMILRELQDGQHIRPSAYPGLIARAFFHLPEELLEEVQEAGFTRAQVLPVEGPGWAVPNFDAMWQEPTRREAILTVVRAAEAQPSIMGMSPHLFAVASS